MSINNPFEGHEGSLSPERIQKLEELAEGLQANAGVSFKEPFICQVVLNAPEASAIDLRHAGAGAQITLLENTSLAEVAHELGHLLIDEEFSHILDNRIRESLLEGVIDLLAADTVNIPRSDYVDMLHSLGQTILTDYAEQVQTNIRDAFLSNTQEQVFVTGHDIDHIVGRTFIAEVLNELPQINTKSLIGCLREHPPSREQLLNATSYIAEYLNDYEPTTGAVDEPVLPNFSDKVQRLI